jgi:ketosteroid isomerase-like protein
MTNEAVATRRRFFWHAGALLSAPLAVAAAPASGGGADDAAQLLERLATLEDVNAIRALNQTYARLVNACARAELAALFADPRTAQVDASIRGVAADAFGAADVIEVSADHATATARVHCIVQVATELEPDCTLVQMAREQGEGVVRHAERRVLETAYVKQGGVWKIERSTYRPA